MESREQTGPEDSPRVDPGAMRDALARAETEAERRSRPSGGPGVILCLLGSHRWRTLEGHGLRGVSWHVGGAIRCSRCGRTRGG